MRKARGGFKWADYQGWPDNERWEIIGGEAFAMSPSPSARHQHIGGELFAQMLRRFRGQPCRVFVSPLDVKLSEEDVVQPDILVVCDPKQLKPTPIEGAPTLVVEVLSPGSLVHDRRRKTELYARFGIRELWLVSPHPSLVELLVLDRRAYRAHRVYEKTNVLASPTFPKLKVRLRPVYDFPLEPGEQPRIVRERPAVYRRASDP